ncbi:unnamed protein product [Phytophthora lilii]|uniref:Unnamed protein product n=1 Tax=Phytophthora lilii TaxID=2077276 RepID=A0A9W6TFK6_9STRA|nr:unnamed protein product [Phytophthora lilii]
MIYFHEVLFRLEQAGLRKQFHVTVYFLVKADEWEDFKLNNIEDHDLLVNYDSSWTPPEDRHGKVRMFEMPVTGGSA